MHNVADLTGVAVVAVAATLCGMLFVRLRQPAIVGYIIAGITLAQINAGGLPAPATIQNITLTPSTAAAGVYNTNPQGNALGLNNGVMELIPPPAGAFTAFDAQIDFPSPVTEFGINIGDWIGPMILDFFSGGAMVATFTTPGFAVGGTGRSSCR